jgi:type II secretory pathway pseudopilin PulG
MNLHRARGPARRVRAFTLVEVLAALVFMAIVIPATIQALQIATLAGEVAERKAVAARVAQRILDENIVTTNWDQSALKGVVTDGNRDFNWTLSNDAWSENPMRLLTVEVDYAAQGKNYSVRLSTLADNSTPFSGTTSQPGTSSQPATQQ